MIRVFAAGSLRLAFNEAASEFAKAGGGEIEFSFASSGLLRERLKRGDQLVAAVQASAGAVEQSGGAGCGRSVERQKHGE